MIFTSKSCITRVAQKLGFKSLYEIKLFVQHEFAKYDLYYDIQYDSTIETWMRNLRSYNNYAINETLIYLDLKIFHEICMAVINARKIVIFGIGSSFLAAMN